MSQILLKALQDILEGSDHTGRWLDASGAECDENAPGARWEEFTAEEQAGWLSSVAETARVAIAHYNVDTMHWAKQLTDAQITAAIYEGRSRGAAIAVYDDGELATIFYGRDWEGFMGEHRDSLEETMCEAARAYANRENPETDISAASSKRCITGGLSDHDRPASA